MMGDGEASQTEDKRNMARRHKKYHEMGFAERRGYYDEKAVFRGPLPYHLAYPGDLEAQSDTRERDMRYDTPGYISDMNELGRKVRGATSDLIYKNRRIAGVMYDTDVYVYVSDIYCPEESPLDNFSVRVSFDADEEFPDEYYCIGAFWAGDMCPIGGFQWLNIDKFFRHYIFPRRLRINGGINRG